MPRLHVDLRPSTVHFEDGENPVVGGLARFGTAMAHLPIQIAQIRMEQAQLDERNNEFQAEHQLRMHDDERAGEAHKLRMAGMRGENVLHGFQTPDIPDNGAVSPDQIREDELAKYGREDREADLQQKRYHATDPRAAGHWEPIPEGKMGEGRKLYNTQTHEIIDVDPAEPAPAAKAPAKPSGNWWTAPGAPSAFNRHIPARPPAQAPAHADGLPQMSQPDAAAADPAGAAVAQPTDADDAAYDKAKLLYDQGDHKPLEHLMRTSTRARERATADSQSKKDDQLQKDMQLVHTYDGSAAWGVPTWAKTAGRYVVDHLPSAAPGMTP